VREARTKGEYLSTYRRWSAYCSGLEIHLVKSVTSLCAFDQSITFWRVVSCRWSQGSRLDLTNSTATRQRNSTSYSKTNSILRLKWICFDYTSPFSKPENFWSTKSLLGCSVLVSRGWNETKSTWEDKLPIPGSGRIICYWANLKNLFKLFRFLISSWASSPWRPLVRITLCTIMW